MLDEHRHVVEALRDTLVERDELIGEEIVNVIEAAMDAADAAEAVEAEIPTVETATVDLTGA